MAALYVHNVTDIQIEAPRKRSTSDLKWYDVTICATDGEGQKTEITLFMSGPLKQQRAVLNGITKQRAKKAG